MVSGQAWAEFFARLVHGSELATATVRIAPPNEVAAACGDDALGCYSGGLLVMPGEQFGGVMPEEIARHEYGHHVAASRAQPAVERIGIRAEALVDRDAHLRPREGGHGVP